MLRARASSRASSARRDVPPPVADAIRAQGQRAGGRAPRRQPRIEHRGFAGMRHETLKDCLLAAGEMPEIAQLRDIRDRHAA